MDESVSSKQTPEKVFRVKENLELPQIPLIKQYMQGDGWIILLHLLKSSECSGSYDRSSSSDLKNINFYTDPDCLSN